jgi:hypothetical protein
MFVFWHTCEYGLSHEGMKWHRATWLLQVPVVSARPKNGLLGILHGVLKSVAVVGLHACNYDEIDCSDNFGVYAGNRCIILG